METTISISQLPARDALLQVLGDAVGSICRLEAQALTSIARHEPDAELRAGLRHEAADLRGLATRIARLRQQLDEEEDNERLREIQDQEIYDMLALEEERQHNPGWPR